MNNTCNNSNICVFHNSHLTRLHSSRMHTARVLTVSPSMLCDGGVSAPGGDWSRGPGSAGGAWSWGAWSQGGGIPACTEADPPCEQNYTRLWKYNLAPTSLRVVIRWIQQNKIYNKMTYLATDGNRVTCLAVSHCNHYIRMISMLRWGCNLILIHARVNLSNLSNSSY